MEYINKLYHLQNVEYVDLTINEKYNKKHKLELYKDKSNDYYLLYENKIFHRLDNINRTVYTFNNKIIISRFLEVLKYKTDKIEKNYIFDKIWYNQYIHKKFNDRLWYVYDTKWNKIYLTGRHQYNNPKCLKYKYINNKIKINKFKKLKDYLSYFRSYQPVKGVYKINNFKLILNILLEKNAFYL